LTLANCNVSGNTGNFAGGIYNDSIFGALTLTNTTVSGNVGGGIVNVSDFTGESTIKNSTVSSNAADYFGGGIADFSYYGLALIDTTVSGNVAYSGGGGISSFELTLTNSTVSGNTASYGGGIRSGAATVSNSTVSGNEASESGGGIVSSFLTLTNSIVAHNGTSPPNCDVTSVDSLGYNLSDDSSCGLTAPSDLLVADAMLGPLADNGGPTETHALLPGSPAIDAGSPDCPPPATDQRGVVRPQGARCDIGAFEAEQAALVVEIDIKPSSDSNPINLSSQGDLAVAILGSESFDVTDVDVTTLAFGSSAAAPVHDLTESGTFEDHLRDINDDGLTDLVSHYPIRQTGIAPGDVEACITGETIDGVHFEGCDAIRTVRGRRQARR
jgi:hypothetical protein